MFVLTNFATFTSRPVCRTPETDFYYAPTTVRRTPAWYSTCQSSITTLIAAQVQDQQTRILPLPGFLIDPAHLDPDGVHLLPVFGQEYCRHLIDSARYAIFITLCPLGECILTLPILPLLHPYFISNCYSRKMVTIPALRPTYIQLL